MPDFEDVQALPRRPRTMLIDHPGWARALAALGTPTGPMPPSNQSKAWFDAFDHEVVLDVVVFAQGVGVDGGPAGVVVQEVGEFLGFGQVAGGVTAAFDGGLDGVGVEVAMLPEAFRQFLVTVPAARMSSSPAMTLRIMK